MSTSLLLKLKAAPNTNLLNTWETSQEPVGASSCALAQNSTIAVADGTRQLPDGTRESWILTLAPELPLTLLAGDRVTVLAGGGELQLSNPAPVTIALATGDSCLIQIQGDGTWKFVRTQDRATVLQVRRPANIRITGGCHQPPNCEDPLHFN